eukprot:jgi/Chrzof1/1366/Cz10g05010.t1
MVYIRNGAVVQKRSPWRFSIITDGFWTIIGALVLFLRTLIDPNTHQQTVSSSSRGVGRRPDDDVRRGGRGRIMGMSDFKDTGTGSVNCAGGG